MKVCSICFGAIIFLCFYNCKSGAALVKNSAKITASQTEIISQNEALYSSEKDRRITGFEITGNTVFTTKELQGILIVFVGKQVSGELGLDIRRTLTNFYAERGYTSSFATISQVNERGIVSIEILEGRIEVINVEVDGYLRSGYVRSRLRQLDRVYNQQQLDRAILNLQELDENIASLDVRVKIDPAAPGTVELDVNAIATRAVNLAGISANTGAIFFGDVVGALQVDSRVFGNGDLFSATATISGGTEGFSLRYSTPVNSRNVKVFAAYGQNAGNVVETLLNVADINIESEQYSLGLQIPFVEDISERFSIALSGNVERSISRLEGERAALLRGADDRGRLQTTTVNLQGSYFVRDAQNLFNWDGRLTVGLDALGSTIDSNGGADSRFTVLRNQLGYIRVFNPESQSFLQLRGDLQLAKDSLPAFAATGIGGLNTVRGYGENVVFADNVLVLSGQLFVPLYRSEERDIILQLVPFVDYGKGWNTEFENPDVSSLFSLGTGLRFGWGERLFFRVDYGIPLINSQVNSNDGFLPDSFHFGLIVRP